ncbi:MAG TPA: hypothetical protein VLG67_00560 [Candidatus Saccharimonadales bacterium]|nr:hypothetical protein [Candidatus Saccharimonadales bacterium]
MKALRNYLTFNSIVALLSAAAFLFFPHAVTASQGATIAPGALIFVKTVGGLILSIAVLDWYARDLKDAKMMEGVLITNFLVHASSVAIDTMGVTSGVISGGTEWYNIAIRGLIALGFLYFIVKNPLKKS